MLWSPGMTLADVEKEVILKALQFYGGNKTRTAASLDIGVRTIDNKLAIYNGAQNDEHTQEGKEIGSDEDEEMETVSGTSTSAGVCDESATETSKERSVSMRKRKKV